MAWRMIILKSKAFQSFSWLAGKVAPRLPVWNCERSVESLTYLVGKSVLQKHGLFRDFYGMPMKYWYKIY